MSEGLLWQHLMQQIEREISSVPAVAGVAVLDLHSGQEISGHGDEVFPTASTIKIHILAQLFRRAEAGELDLSRRIPVTASLHAPGSGILTYLDDTEQLTVRNLATLMIIVSDNTATNLCIDWATPEGTNAMLQHLGLEKTRLRRKMQDHQAVLKGDENTATPREIVTFLKELHQPQRLSRYVCEETLKILKKPKRGFLMNGLPIGVEMANKPGAMDRVRCDAGIVYLKRRPYAICVMTKFGLDHPSLQEEFIGAVARLTHTHMTALDTTSSYGQGVAPELLG